MGVDIDYPVLGGYIGIGLLLDTFDKISLLIDIGILF